MDNKLTRYDIKDNGDHYENLGGEWVDATDAIETIKALEAENAALREKLADVDVGIDNWLDHIEKYGADDQVIQSMRNLLEGTKR